MVSESEPTQPPSYEDDFERVGSLSENWTIQHSGFGLSTAGQPPGELAVWNEELSQQAVSLKLVDPAKAFPPPQVRFSDSRRVHLAETCAGCGQRWDAGHVATSYNGQPFRHTDCSDPRLEREVGADGV